MSEWEEQKAAKYDVMAAPGLRPVSRAEQVAQYLNISTRTLNRYVLVYEQHYAKTLRDRPIRGKRGQRRYPRADVLKMRDAKAMVDSGKAGSFVDALRAIDGVAAPSPHIAPPWARELVDRQSQLELRLADQQAEMRKLLGILQLTIEGNNSAISELLKRVPKNPNDKSPFWQRGGRKDKR